MILPLVYYGDSRLRKKCEPITEISQEVLDLAQNLRDTVDEYHGAGLAAPQVGVLLQMFVVLYAGEDEQGDPILGEPTFFLNPKLSNPSSEEILEEEGCLSIPGAYGKVLRPHSITVEAMDLKGNIFTEEVSGWRARAIMHENDHINGVLYPDRMTKRRRKLLEPALKQIKKQYNS